MLRYLLGTDIVIYVLKKRPMEMLAARFCAPATDFSMPQTLMAAGGNGQYFLHGGP